MGSFPGCCGFSGLTVQEGDEAMVFFIKVKAGHFTPVSPPVLCRYEDCGRYTPVDPPWYRDLVLDGIDAGGRHAGWGAAMESTEVQHCSIHRGVYDVLMDLPDIYPEYKFAASVKAMVKVIKGTATTAANQVNAASFYHQVYRALMDKQDADLALTPLECKLLVDLEGTAGSHQWLTRYVEPVVQQPRHLTFVLQRLLGEHKIHAVMRATQQPWGPPSHTAPQDGNEALVGYLSSKVAAVAWNQAVRLGREE